MTTIIGGYDPPTRTRTPVSRHLGQINRLWLGWRVPGYMSEDCSDNGTPSLQWYDPYPRQSSPLTIKVAAVLIWSVVVGGIRCGGETAGSGSAMKCRKELMLMTSPDGEMQPLQTKSEGIVPGEVKRWGTKVRLIPVQ